MPDALERVGRMHDYPCRTRQSISSKPRNTSIISIIIIIGFDQPSRVFLVRRLFKLVEGGEK